MISLDTDQLLAIILACLALGILVGCGIRSNIH